MAGALEHSPADILCQLLIDLGLGTEKSDGTDWPIVPNYEPDTPDNCITIYDTEGRIQGRLQYGGRNMDKHGIQLRFRSYSPKVGYAKANDVIVALDETIYQNLVTIDSNTYCVNTIDRIGNVISLGKEEDTKRSIYTVNALMIVKKKV